jgi:hypothetical protein
MNVARFELKSAALADYLHAPIPTEDDAAIRSFVRNAAANGSSENAFALTDAEALVLVLFAERMAALAVRENSGQHVKDGLLALAIEAGNLDLSESLGSTSVLWDAATRVMQDPESVFAECCQRAPESEFLDALRHFLRCPPEERSLEAWAYEVFTDCEGFRYQRWGSAV